MAKKDVLYTVSKRMIDIVCSLLGLTILSPIFIITMIAILIEDGRPFFYCQNRIGKDKKEFRIYKFRSMYKNAEQIHEQMKKEYGCTEVSFKLKDDPRVTKVGKVIRKYNIDELPQLVNVLKGDMSLVGPRPLPTYEFEDEQKKYGDKYRLRYEVPQGLTCYWQLSSRAEVDFSDRMQMDVIYVGERSFWGDIKLILLTFVYAFTGKAAY
jgi:lipopolysaccharide/colanic/teichoic acid biosynthesis glycosyltransferase